MDRGARWATVRRVAQSQTRLSETNTFTFISHLRNAFTNQLGEYAPWPQKAPPAPFVVSPPFPSLLLQPQASTDASAHCKLVSFSKIFYKWSHKLCTLFYFNLAPLLTIIMLTFHHVVACHQGFAGLYSF